MLGCMRRLLLFAASVTLLLVACAGEGNPAATGTEVTGGTGTATPEALAFEAPLVGGGTFVGADHDGRDVALWFWAPW